MGAKKDRKRAKAEERARAKAIARSKRISEDARSSSKKPGGWIQDPREVLSIGPDFTLTGFTRDATPGWSGSEKKSLKVLAARGAEFSELQERLYAASKEGASDSVLLILQGLDTAGKGGIVRHVIGQVDPQGIALAAFKAPSEEERAHDFLWRIRPRLPRAGYIGVFDRSHYEDLLVPTALALTGEESAFIASEDELNRRYHDIYEMEAEATRTGMRIVKVCLVVSYREQGKRLAERLERADKQWKFSMGDLDTRTHWDSYQEAYSEVLRRTSTRVAPWYVVPADHKWYARLAVQELLVRTLEDVDPQWPAADFDVDEAKRRLATTTSPEALRLHSDEHLAAARVAAKGERGTDDHIAVEAMSPLTDFVP
ncbi:PPK2 family polyphosphate kinase [Actinomyces mediterranea]|uniref:PPK2 family polyphosphate kinase n=1 Tax=Actinomyces mediterranea TaxID=1871028 RepID=UPI0009713FFB|nr:PPK2 family polyphosphate kinase [Actinomyces mediterranea]